MVSFLFLTCTWDFVEFISTGSMAGPVSYTHLDVYKRQVFFYIFQIRFCTHPYIVEYSRPVVFGEDWLRERGSLLATFYVLTRVIVSMTNDNCRTFKQNQIILCIPSSIVDNSRSVDYVEDRLRDCGSLPATFYVGTREHFP